MAVPVRQGGVQCGVRAEARQLLPQGRLTPVRLQLDPEVRRSVRPPVPALSLVRVELLIQGRDHVRWCNETGRHLPTELIGPGPGTGRGIQGNREYDSCDGRVDLLDKVAVR